MTASRKVDLSLFKTEMQKIEGRNISKGSNGKERHAKTKQKVKS